MQEQIYALIKFGSEHNLKKLLETGELRFAHPLNDYHKSTNSERDDYFEGSQWVENIDSNEILEIKCNHPTIGEFNFKPKKHKRLQLIQYDFLYLSLSFYAISENIFKNTDSYKIDEKNLGFNKHAILITEPYRFLNSIIFELKKENIEYKMDFVKYKEFDKKGNITTGPFDKKDEHSHQMEYRIIIKNINDKAKFLEIGNISEYSHIVSSKSIIDTEWKTN